MLEVTGLRVAYGGIQAVRSITFHVNEGEMVALIGANGAGKTSTLKAVARVLDAAGGDVHFCGEKITRIAAHDIIRKGIALVPEGRGVFPDLTVAENLFLGAYARRARKSEAANLAMVLDLFPRLAERRRQTVSTMSGGEQQMVAIGRALMSAPTLLMLDEPSLGLAPVLVGELFQSLAKVGQAGVGLLIVEQNVRISLSIAHRGYLLEAGRMVGEGPAAKLADDASVQHAFLGTAAET